MKDFVMLYVTMCKTCEISQKLDTGMHNIGINTERL